MLVRTFDNGKDLGCKTVTADIPEWKILLKIRQYIDYDQKRRFQTYCDRFEIRRILHDGEEAMLFSRAVSIDCLPVISGNYFLTFHERSFRGIYHEWNDFLYNQSESSLEYVFEFTEEEIVKYLAPYFTTTRLEEIQEDMSIDEESVERKKERENRYQAKLTRFLGLVNDTNKRG